MAQDLADEEKPYVKSPRFLSMSWNGPNLPDLAFAHRALNADNPDN